MIKIENVDVYGWESAIRGMRNPLNSWEKSDSSFAEYSGSLIEVGDADHALMMQLVKAGSDHSKFMRMITVTADITAPLYWWKEMDTYKVGTVRNSCSTMHTIHKREFVLDDFSYEHLAHDQRAETGFDEVLYSVVVVLNKARECYLETGDKFYWWQIIQLLPSSYNQKATWQANYSVLRNIYHARKNHKLDEWHDFCAWVESLPCPELITGDETR